jgi:hypothetical protein
MAESRSSARERDRNGSGVIVHHSTQIFEGVVCWNLSSITIQNYAIFSFVLPKPTGAQPANKSL